MHLCGLAARVWNRRRLRYWRTQPGLLRVPSSRLCVHFISVQRTSKGNVGQVCRARPPADHRGHAFGGDLRTGVFTAALLYGVHKWTRRRANAPRWGLRRCVGVWDSPAMQYSSDLTWFGPLALRQWQITRTDVDSSIKDKNTRLNRRVTSHIRKSFPVSKSSLLLFYRLRAFEAVWIFYLLIFCLRGIFPI